MLLEWSVGSLLVYGMPIQTLIRIQADYGIGAICKFLGFGDEHAVNR